MTKNEFMTALYQALSGLSEAERADIMSDYEEHFRMGAASGKSEQEIAESLGSPNDVAAQFMNEDAAVPSKKEKKSRDTANVIIRLVVFVLLVLLDVWLYWNAVCSALVAIVLPIAIVIIAFAGAVLSGGLVIGLIMIDFAFIGFSVLLFWAAIAVSRALPKYWRAFAEA